MSLLDKLKETYKEKTYLVDTEALKKEIEAKLIREADLGYRTATLATYGLKNLAPVANQVYGLDIIEETLDTMGIPHARAIHSAQVIAHGWAE